MVRRAPLVGRLGACLVVGDPSDLAESPVGGGGMSRVFVAIDRNLGRPVVVKLLEPDVASGVSLERFAREIKLAATLQHPLHRSGAHVW